MTDSWKTLTVKRGHPVGTMKYDRFICNLLPIEHTMHDNTFKWYYKVEIGDCSDINVYVIKLSDRVWMHYKCNILSWKKYDIIYFDDYKFDENGHLIIHTIPYEEMQSLMTA